MTTVVVGANGATGRLLVEQLLERGQRVNIIVRSVDRLAEHIKSHTKLSATQASLLALDEAELARQVRDCGAVASCLRHNMSLKGIFGPPRDLVTEATRRLCQAIKANAPTRPVKFVLMNSSGNTNRDLEECVSLGQQCVISALRILVPPHADNERAADYLRTKIGQDDAAVEWAAVRPDALIDADAVTAYEIHASPTRSAIFDAGHTSRINVAHFIAELIVNAELWNLWKGRMPVIYNTAAAP